MGKIMKNGIPYGGGSISVELTQDEYDALTEEENMNGTIYFITDKNKIYRKGVVYGEGGGGTGETPTLDAVLKKGNETSGSASFTDSNDRRTDVSYDGSYMTGAGTEGMRQVSVNQNGIRAIDNLVGTITPKFVVPFEPSGEDQVAMSDAVKESFKKALDTNAKIIFDNEYQYLEIRDGNGTDIGFSQETENTVRIQEYAKDDRGQVQPIFDETLPNKTYVDGKVGVNIEVGKERWQGTYTDETGTVYQVYSKMVYIPALPATAGITTYEHGVANIKQILNIYGFTADGFVLNAPRQNAQDNIAIYQASKSASNQTFSIEVGKDRSSKKAYVVMVYAKNN